MLEEWYGKGVLIREVSSIQGFSLYLSLSFSP